MFRRDDRFKRIYWMERWVMTIYLLMKETAWQSHDRVRLRYFNRSTPPSNLGHVLMYTASLHLPATSREIVPQLEGVRVVSVVENFTVLSTSGCFDMTSIRPVNSWSTTLTSTPSCFSNDRFGRVPAALHHPPRPHASHRAQEFQTDHAVMVTVLLLYSKKPEWCGGHSLPVSPSPNIIIFICFSSWKASIIARSQGAR